MKASGRFHQRKGPSQCTVKLRKCILTALYPTQLRRGAAPPVPDRAEAVGDHGPALGAGRGVGLGHLPLRLHPVILLQSQPRRGESLHGTSFQYHKKIHRYLIVKGGVDIPGPGWLDTNHEENPRQQAAAKTELHQEQLHVQKQD